MKKLFSIPHPRSLRRLTSCFALAWAISTPLQAQTIYSATVSSSDSHSFLGWGFTPDERTMLLNQANPNPTSEIPTISDPIYNELKPTFVRVQINPEMLENIDASGRIVLDAKELENLRVLLGSAKKSRDSFGGVKHYIMSVWSPPARFKTNDSTSGAGGATIKTASIPNYAKYYVEVIRQVSSYKYDGTNPIGLPFAISVQNEPENQNTWRACYYGSASEWHSVVSAVRSALNTAGYSGIKIYGPEVEKTGNVGNYLGSAFTNNSNVGALAWHGYGNSNSYASTSAFQAGISNNSGKERWQTEDSSFNDTNFALGDLNGKELDWIIPEMMRMGAHLIDAKAQYWAYWRPHRTDRDTSAGAALSWGGRSDSNVGFTRSRRWGVYEKIWSNAQAGFGGWNVRRFSNSTIPNLKRNNDGGQISSTHMFALANNSKMVVVMVNSTATAYKAKIGGINRGSSLTHFVTDGWSVSDSRNMQNVGTVALNNGLTASAVTLPARSVNVFITDGTTAQSVQSSPTTSPSEQKL